MPHHQHLPSHLCNIMFGLISVSMVLNACTLRDYRIGAAWRKEVVVMLVFEIFDYLKNYNFLDCVIVDEKIFDRGRICI